MWRAGPILVGHHFGPKFSRTIWRSIGSGYVFECRLVANSVHGLTSAERQALSPKGRSRSRRSILRRLDQRAVNVRARNLRAGAAFVAPGPSLFCQARIPDVQDVAKQLMSPCPGFTDRFLNGHRGRRRGFVREDLLEPDADWWHVLMLRATPNQASCPGVSSLVIGLMGHNRGLRTSQRLLCGPFFPDGVVAGVREKASARSGCPRLMDQRARFGVLPAARTGPRTMWSASGSLPPRWWCHRGWTGPGRW